MEVQIISKTVQKFNGESFYLCGEYFQHKGRRLHRTVWEYYNGIIPKGYHVHHKDGNKTNNDIANLELLTKSEHIGYHMKTEEAVQKSRERIKKAIAAAPAWHHSEEGKQWHSENGKAQWRNRTLNTYYCSFCGKEYQTKHRYSPKSNHFCSNNCRASYRRRRLRNEG